MAIDDGLPARREKTSAPWMVAATLVLALAFLYWAQPVLIPVALAILLAFLLSPIADGLQRIGFGRIVAVILVALLACSLIAGLGWLTGRQIVSLANDLPQYKENIIGKISDLRRLGRGGVLEKVQRTVEEVKKNVEKEDGKPAAKTPPPAPVEPRPPPRFWEVSFGKFLELAGGAGLVFFLVIFIMIEREELRNRIIRLVGYGRMNVTTKALEEISRRISRYLLMQSLINGSYGLALGAGLFFMGLPYSLLWGFLAAAFRFIPYVGVWIGALMPFALGLAVFPGWLWPLSILGLFLALEAITSMVLEPLLYGHSAGVSQVALLVSIAFWTWLWGPVGLMIATPMTVCLVVLGKYIPELNFIVVLMSDEPVMQTERSYYQRLLASDYDEAAEIVERYLKDHPPEEAFDDILLPALYQTKLDYRQGKLTHDDEEFIFRATAEIIDGTDIGRERPARADKDAEGTKRDGAAGAKVLVFSCPARDEADDLGLRMLGRLLDGGPCDLKIAPGALAFQKELAAGERTPDLICIGTVAPGGLAQTRHLAKKLRARFPKLKILIARWGLANDFNEIESQKKLLLAAGADRVATTLVEAREEIFRFCAPASQAPPPFEHPSRNRPNAT